MPANPDDVPEVAEVERALHLVDLAFLDLHRVDQLLAKAFAHPRRDLQANDLAEAAPAKLLLDGLEHVVGLVGDVVVGVAGDAEGRVVEDLHAGEERTEVRRDEVLERHEDRVLAIEAKEAPQELLRDLDARERLRAGVRIAQHHGEAEGQVGDVGERAPEPDEERRQGREDPALEQAVELRALLARGVLRVHEPDPVLGEARYELGPEAAGDPRPLLRHDLGDRVDLLVRAEAVGSASGSVGLDVVMESRQAHHEDLVQVGLPDRAELHALEQRDALVLGELQDAVVEVEP